VALSRAPAPDGIALGMAIGALYALLSAALHLGAEALGRIGARIREAGWIGVGALVAWHVREQAGTPVDAGWLVLLGLGCGAGLGLLARAIGTRDAPAGRGLAAVGAGALLVAGLAAGWQVSPDLRWELLRHHKLLGTPSYHLFAAPVERVREAVWQAHAGPDPAPPPQAALVSAERPRDVVILLVDTLRADALAAFGGEGGQMPLLDRIAARSICLADVQSNSAWTRPAVGSLFTGLLPEEHGAADRGDRLPESRDTLAERLRARGYRTGAFVANWANVGRASGFDQGFDVFEELQEPEQPYARGAAVAQAARDWLGGAVGAAPERPPVFLYAHFLDPHTPYLHGGDARSHAGAREAYARELRVLDGVLFELHADLRRALGPDAVILVTSDHGEEFGDHGERGHGHSLYRELLHVPAIVSGAGAGGQALHAPLETRDLFELVLRLAQAPRLDVAAWAREAARRARYASVYSSTPGMGPHRPYLREVGMRSLERDGWQLIWSAYGETQELYDRARDPYQTRNLARREPERLRALSGELDAFVPRFAQRVPIADSEATIEMLRALGYVR
jgi:arylsulfatase A-like enzyme